jgi:hypothetical protein
MKIFENRLLWRICGNKKYGSWKKLHNGLHYSYPLPNMNVHVKEDEMNRVCSMHGKEEPRILRSGRKRKR